MMCHLPACSGGASGPVLAGGNGEEVGSGPTAAPAAGDAAAGSDVADDGSMIDDLGSDGTTPDAQPGEADAPQILSFGSNVQELTAGESVTFVAVVSMPGGLQNLVGGELTSEDGRIRFGGFVATTQGTYTLQLSWADVYQATKFTFEKESTLRARATFYANDGKRTSRDVSLRLHCDKIASALRGSCGGKCTGFDTAEHCGSCATSCPGECMIERGAATCTETVTKEDATLRSCVDVCREAQAGVCRSALQATSFSPNGDATSQPVSCEQPVPPPETVEIVEWFGWCACRGFDGLSESGAACSSTCQRSGVCGGQRVRARLPDGRVADQIIVAEGCTSLLPVGGKGTRYRKVKLTCACNGPPRATR